MALTALILLPLLLTFGLFAVFDGGDDAPQTDPDAPNGDATNGDDVLTLGPEADLLRAGDGNDVVFGGDGFDRIEGGNGDDVLYGEGGRDLLLGQMGNDSLFGGDGADGLFGGNGADQLNGGGSYDMLIGGNGADRLAGDAGGDLLIGGQGADTLFGGDGDDILIGGQMFSRDLTPSDYFALRSDPNLDTLPDFRLTATDPDFGNSLNGGNGDDLLFLGNGDQAVGGAGADDFVVGPWIKAGSAPVINDFSTTDDVLVVSYQGPIAPDVEIRDGGLYLVGATDPLVIAAGLTDLSSVQLLQIAT